MVPKRPTLLPPQRVPAGAPQHAMPLHSPGNRLQPLGAPEIRKDRPLNPMGRKLRAFGYTAAHRRLVLTATSAANVSHSAQQDAAQQPQPEADAGLELFKRMIGEKRFTCTQCGKCCTGSGEVCCAVAPSVFVPFTSDCRSLFCSLLLATRGNFISALWRVSHSHWRGFCVALARRKKWSLHCCPARRCG